MGRKLMTSDPEPKFRTCERFGNSAFSFYSKGNMDTTNTESLSYKILAHGNHVCAFMFNERGWDCQLVPLSGGPLTDKEIEDHRARGLLCVGMAGFLNGKLCSWWEQPIIEGSAIDFLSRRYCEWLYQTTVTEAPSRMESDGAVAWLKALLALPDPRTAN
jgi:hypothetical protein